MTTPPPPLVPALVSDAGPLAGLGVPVVTRVLSPRPERFVRVIGVGGTDGFALSRPRALIECWAHPDTPDAAYDLAVEAWAALRDTDHTEITPGLWIAEVQLTLPVDYPDTQSGSPRWQFTFSPLVAFDEHRSA